VTEPERYVNGVGSRIPPHDDIAMHAAHRDQRIAAPRSLDCMKDLLLPWQTSSTFLKSHNVAGFATPAASGDQNHGSQSSNHLARQGRKPVIVDALEVLAVVAPTIGLLVVCSKFFPGQRRRLGEHRSGARERWAPPLALTLLGRAKPAGLAADERGSELRPPRDQR
jgi:hypothetical protein